MVSFKMITYMKNNCFFIFSWIFIFIKLGLNNSDTPPPRHKTCNRTHMNVRVVSCVIPTKNALPTSCLDTPSSSAAATPPYLCTRIGFIKWTRIWINFTETEVIPKSIESKLLQHISKAPVSFTSVHAQVTHYYSFKTDTDTGGQVDKRYSRGHHTTWLAQRSLWFETGDHLSLWNGCDASAMSWWLWLGGWSVKRRSTCSMPQAQNSRYLTGAFVVDVANHLLNGVMWEGIWALTALLFSKRENKTK